MDNKGLLIFYTNYQDWKEKMMFKIIDLKLDIWNLVYNGYTKTPPWGEELQKNSQAISKHFFNIPDSILEN